MRTDWYKEVELTERKVLQAARRLAGAAIRRGQNNIRPSTWTVFLAATAHLQKLHATAQRLKAQGKKPSHYMNGESSK